MGRTGSGGLPLNVDSSQTVYQRSQVPSLSPGTTPLFFFFSPHSLSVPYREKRQVILYPIWPVYDSLLGCNDSFWGWFDSLIKLKFPTFK